MRKYRLLAGTAAGLIALAGVLSVTAGGTPPVPPPVSLRGSASMDTSDTEAEFRVVAPTVAELVPTSRRTPSTTIPPAPDRPDGPDGPTAPPPAAGDSASADSPAGLDSPDSPSTTEESVAGDPAAGSAQSADSPDEPVPADSPDEPASADSPDEPVSADSLDSVDSPDD